MCFLTRRIMVSPWFSALSSFEEPSANVSTFCVPNLLLKYFQMLHRVHTKSWCLFSLAFSCELKFSLFPVLLAVVAGAELVYTGGLRRKEREDGIGHQKGTAQSRQEHTQILCSIPPNPVTSAWGFSFNFLLDLACLSHCSTLLRYLNFRWCYTE